MESIPRVMTWLMVPPGNKNGAKRPRLVFMQALAGSGGLVAFFQLAAHVHVGLLGHGLVVH